MTFQLSQNLLIWILQHIKNQELPLPLTDSRDAETQRMLNKVSPQRDVTLLTRRRVLPPGELRCISECYRRRRQTMTTTDASDRY